MEEQKYYKEDSHWGIFFIKVTEALQGNVKQKRNYCIKGCVYNPVIGNHYEIKGIKTTNSIWGEEISVEECLPLIQIESDNISGQKYIIYKLFPKWAKKMYDTLENPYLSLKEKKTSDLTKVKGIGIDRASNFIAKFYETESRHKSYLELARLNVSDSLLDKVLKDCNNDVDKTIDLIKNHPYRLTNINGIGWKTADDLALKNGLDPYGVERIKTCISLFLKTQANNGKSYSFSEEIMTELIDKIGDEIPDLNIAEAMHDLHDKGIIIWSKDKNKIGLKRYYELEINIGENLKRLKEAPNKFYYENWEEIINKKEKEQGWNYTEQQIQGIQMVLENQVCCISGYGGTGKTSIIDGILTILEDYKGITVALAGRAAARINEASGKESKTIHKLLELSYMKGSTDYNYKNNPLDYDIIVIDEMSMIDGYLCNSLLQACATGTKVIFIGDIGQLESIGCCAVAADMLESSYIPSIFLDKIHRQAQKSAIITESIKVRQGRSLIKSDWSGEETRGELQDMILNCYTDKSNTYHNIVKYFKEEIMENKKSILDVQIIVPCKQGVSSVFSLNHIAQQIYNPKSKKEYVTRKDGVVKQTLRIGDKVINKLNKYNIKNRDGSKVDIFNGNIGIVKDITNEYLAIDFQGIGLVDVPKTHGKHIELGYAITCHSAQGSQFDTVIGGLDFSMFMMLNRELLYTMITRASKKLYLCAQNKALNFAIMKHQIITRQTYLLEILENISNKKTNFEF